MGNSVSQEERDRFLSVAAEKGEVQKVDQWLKKGADPNKLLEDGEKRNRTSLHRAASTKNNVDVLTKLLTYIKDVDMTDDDGNTALHLAAGYYNNAAVVQTLLHAKPNCKIQNSKGKTALHSAIENGSDWKIVELLLRADSDPNISDFKGNTPLHVCASKQSCDDIVAGMLLRFGANPNLKNAEGQTPLHVAAKAGNKVVLLLLKFHAKVRLRDKSGRRPSDLADTEEMKKILEFEEDCLEERTVRVFSTPPFMMSPNGRYSYRNSTNSYNNGGNAVTPNGKRLHFWAGDTNEWRGYGGDGIIHLPDKSDVVVPPQAIPQGTDFKINITPSKKDGNEDVPEIDFDRYDFEVDIKLDLPGALLIAPWMAESNPSIEKIATNLTSPPAFTGFCTEGSNQWKSFRELACKHDGVVGLHFNLTREKGERRSYKIPQPNRRSFTEVVLQRPPTSKNRLENGLEEASRSSSSLSVFSNGDSDKENETMERKVDEEPLDINHSNEISSPDLLNQEEVRESISSSSSDSDSDDENHGEKPMSVSLSKAKDGAVNNILNQDQDYINTNSFPTDAGKIDENPGEKTAPVEPEDGTMNFPESSIHTKPEIVEKLSDFLNDKSSSSSEDEYEQAPSEFNQEKDKSENKTNSPLAYSLAPVDNEHMSYDEIMEKFNHVNYTETDANEDLIGYDDQPRYQHPIDPALATIVEDYEEQSVSSVRSADVDLL